MKTKPLNCLLALITCASLTFSCKEFIEPSISKRQINPEAPGNNYVSTQYAVNFWWDEVEDALQYRLQIVRPGFDAVESLVMDTVIKNTKFTVSLDPAKYQWRVRAENGSSQTTYSTPRSFEIVASSLSNQKITNLSPANNSTTSQSIVLFKWDGLYNATQYHIQIDTNNFTNTNTLVYDQVVPGQQVNFTLPEKQQYQWRVRAENATEQSLWSAINFIKYDVVPPGAVALKSPLDQAVVSNPVSLQWNTASGAVNYKVYIYRSDAKTLYNGSFPVLVSTTNYTFNQATTGEQIYWKVTAVNTEGNEGQTSDLRSFLLQ